MPLHPPIHDHRESDPAATRGPVTLCLSQLPAHRNPSPRAARGSGCRGRRSSGKFWQMHDAIFHHQHTLEDSDLEQFAEAVGLDMQPFARALADQRALARIEEDVEGGERSGVQGTPTFFINGVLYRGSWEQEALLAALQAASRTS